MPLFVVDDSVQVITLTFQIYQRRDAMLYSLDIYIHTYSTNVS